MKLILTALFSDLILSALKNQPYFTVSQGFNSYSQPIHIISYDSNEHLTQNRPIQKILPTLKALQAVFVNDFIQAIKNQNITNLIAATMQLRAFMSYCNDLAKKIDTEKSSNKPSELLALARPRKIIADYSIFPENTTDNKKKLSVKETEWFSIKCDHLNSINQAQQKTSKDTRALQPTIEPIEKCYVLLLQFLSCDTQSQSVMTTLLPPSITNSRHIIQAVNILSKSTTLITDQISALSNVYEFIKNNTKEENAAISDSLLQFTSQEDQNLIYKRVKAIQQGLSPHLQNPSDKNCTRYASITQEYINELTHTLTFLEFFNKSEDFNNSASREDNINEIKDVLKNNIKSLEDLAAGLETYHNDNQNKSENRKNFASNLIKISKNSTLSVRQRVINIEEKINTPSNKTESGLLEKCWNVLKRIGNAAKGLWHYRNEIKKNAHFEKAANPHESVTLYELKHGSFFPAAEKLGVIKNETNSLR